MFQIMKANRATRIFREFPTTPPRTGSPTAQFLSLQPPHTFNESQTLHPPPPPTQVQVLIYTLIRNATCVVNEIVV